MVIGGLALIGAIILLFNVVGSRDGKDKKPPELATVPPPAIEPMPVVGPAEPLPVVTPDAATDIEMEPATARTPRPIELRPRPPQEGSANPDDPDLAKAPNNPTTSDECDEVSCVLTKYDKPCCERFKPPPVEKPPVAVVDPNAGPVELDKTLIKVGVERYRAMVIRCGEQGGAKGTVSVSVTVKPDGNVQSATVAATPDPALGECVAGILRKATFAKTQNGGSFTYPFVF
jgi:hypothetical protein